MGISLPHWPPRTVGVLTTVDSDGPHAIPVSAPVRVCHDTVLLSLHQARGSLARIRVRPEVALLVLAAGDVACTARGTAQVVAEQMPGAPDYAAVEIAVHAVDDHRQAAFTVSAGAERSWISDYEQKALALRVQTLRQLAVTRIRCRVCAQGA